MKFDFLILGASGIQGKIVSRDLLENSFKICLADLYKEGSLPVIQKFPGRAVFRFIDLREIRKITELIKRSGANVVINCAESDWNLNVYEACLAAGAHVIDLSSSIKVTAKQLALNKKFEKHNLTAITGCGSTPGINNVMLNYASRFFDTIESVNAGFVWDSNIKKFVVPFSIQSVLWEFTEPATIIEDNAWLIKTPLENVLDIEFRTIGRQKCFPVDHAEVLTFHHYFKEKGLKNIRFYAGFPEHSAKVILTLVELGFHKWKKVLVDGKHKIFPPELVTEVFKDIKIPEGYMEKENLWVEISGEKDGEPKKMLMECLVPTLPDWEDAGCNIDTGFPASIIAQMIYDGRITERGSFAPEAVVPPEELFKELGAKSMLVYQDGVIINREHLELPYVSEKSRARKTRQPERAILQLVNY